MRFGDDYWHENFSVLLKGFGLGHDPDALVSGSSATLQDNVLVIEPKYVYPVRDLTDKQRQALKDAYGLEIK